MTDRNSPTGEAAGPQSPFYQGTYGRICDGLAGWTPVHASEEELHDKLLALGHSMLEQHDCTPSEIAADGEVAQALESAWRSNIPAGYTYFGQFIDHDITYDPASSLMRRNDPSGLLNHRTPRLDLDSLYGAGPDASAHLYARRTPDKARKFLIGKALDVNLPDLPRNSEGIALLGDPRNDEHAIIAQLHLAFLLAHNRLVDRAMALNLAEPFEAARTTLVYLYQHLAWNDFIRRVTLEPVFRTALKQEPAEEGGSTWSLGFADIYDWDRSPFIPVEFSVAAYRFGHSMVRNGYQTNDPHQNRGRFVPVFDASLGESADDLRGDRPLTGGNYVQWDWFLEMRSSVGEFPQMARRIDTRISTAMAHMQIEPHGSRKNLIAYRNLLRGIRFDLPSGSDTARALGLTPIRIDPDADSLWYYILKEAETETGGNGLGSLGSMIVASTIAGLLKGDPNSFITNAPDWTPERDPLLDRADRIDSEDWTLASIIRLSGLPVQAAHFATNTPTSASYPAPL